MDIPPEISSLFAPELQADEAIAFMATSHAVAGSFAIPRTPLSAPARVGLKAYGAGQLFVHQAEAYDSAMVGKDTLVTTGTNSGKSLCYALPILEKCLEEPRARALLLFPTKALAQDQQGKLQKLFGDTGLKAATYDSDTAKSSRSSIRNLATAILTNPDMIHYGMLPMHENWIKFIKALRFIVIDEMHLYRGVFGSHTAWVLRRLLRLCQWHGSKPVLIGCSATIGNAGEAFYALTGRHAHVITQNGAPSAERTTLIWNLSSREEIKPQSPNKTCASLMTNLCEEGKQTLCFSQSRVGAELVLRYSRQYAESVGLDPTALDSYRGGYTAKDRRALEKGLQTGKLKGLSSTNALELGVDVASLDAVVLNGYPGTIASFRQQAGRAGRAKRPGLAIYVPREDPLEQYLVRNPEELLQGASETISLNPANKFIARQHLRCAAFERPIRPTELADMGFGALETAEELDQSGELAFSAGMFYYPGYTSPSQEVSLRGAGNQMIKLIVGSEMIGVMDYSQALTSVHEGAVYLHRGETYVSQKLDLERQEATLTRQDTNYYTRALVQSNISVDSLISGELAQFVAATVSDAVIGYRVMQFDGEAVVGVQELDLPEQSYQTLAVRFNFAAPHPDTMELFVAALHGAQHALLAVAPLFCASERSDLGSAWYIVSPDTLNPSIFVYDRFPGGIGLSDMLFKRQAEWIKAAHELLAGCSCESGCPRCIFSSSCESGNEHLSKGGAIVLLEELTETID